MPHSSMPIAIITLSFGIGILLEETGIQLSFIHFVVSIFILVLSHINKWHKLFWAATCFCFLIVGTLRYSKGVFQETTPPNNILVEVLNVQHSSSFGYQYSVRTNTNEAVLLQTSLKHQFHVGDRFYGSRHSNPNNITSKPN